MIKDFFKQTGEIFSKRLKSNKLIFINWNIMYVIVLAEKRIVFVLRSALYIVKFIKQCCMEQVIVFSDE